METKTQMSLLLLPMKAALHARDCCCQIVALVVKCCECASKRWLTEPAQNQHTSKTLAHDAWSERALTVLQPMQSVSHFGLA